jgi:hypothetical protein
MMDNAQTQYSRFQVLCVDRPAWAWPALRRETRYYYDGLRFWSRSTDGDRLLPSWRAPRYGWVHEPGCDCHLCAARSGRATEQRLAS